MSFEAIVRCGDAQKFKFCEMGSRGIFGTWFFLGKIEGQGDVDGVRGNIYQLMAGLFSYCGTSGLYVRIYARASAQDAGPPRWT